MKKPRQSVSLIKAAQAVSLPEYPLTSEQQLYQRAVSVVRERLTELTSMLQVELSRLIHDVDFVVDVQLCQANNLQSWLAEKGRFLLSSSVLIPQDDFGYLAMDYVSLHHLVDLSLGGELTRQPDVKEKADLSRSELRVTSRLLQKQLQALQIQLFNEASAFPAQLIPLSQSPKSLRYVALKVRLVLQQEVLSWYLWLPVSFFATERASAFTGSSAEPALDMSQWPHIPVQGQVQMASRKVSLSLLQECVDKESILPLDMASDMLLKLNNKSLFVGRIAEEGSALVFQITGFADRNN